jgi:hypothetical protein
MGEKGNRFVFVAFDNSDGEAQNERFLISFQNKENGHEFKQAFEAAKLFNKIAKMGSAPQELIWAPKIEDKEEVQADDIDENIAADADAN